MSHYLALRCVLFDLDGTFLDTSQDMGKALNLLREEHNLPALPYELIRPQVSHGARGLIYLGFQITPEDTEFVVLRDRFLSLYEACMFEQTRSFDGIDRVLRTCGLNDLSWGIVTNKPGYLSEKILRHLGYWRHAVAVISGDSLPQRKPHPAPLLKAAELAKVDPRSCCYVGDAERDIEAGRNAGMRTASALWGFLGSDDKVADWHADNDVEQPEDLIPLIQRWRMQ